MIQRLISNLGFQRLMSKNSKRIYGRRVFQMELNARSSIVNDAAAISYLHHQQNLNTLLRNSASGSYGSYHLEHWSEWYHTRFVHSLMEAPGFKKAFYGGSISDVMEHVFSSGTFQPCPDGVNEVICNIGDRYQTAIVTPVILDEKFFIRGICAEIEGEVYSEGWCRDGRRFFKKNEVPNSRSLGSNSVGAKSFILGTVIPPNKILQTIQHDSCNNYMYNSLASGVDFSASGFRFMFPRRNIQRIFLTRYSKIKDIAAYHGLDFKTLDFHLNTVITKVNNQSVHVEVLRKEVPSIANSIVYRGTNGITKVFSDSASK